MACPCGLDVEQPWRERDHVWSPASFIGGVVVAGFGMLALVGIRPWVGYLVFAVLGAAIVTGWIVQARKGHRRWCLLRRGAWFGLAAPGAPVRLLANAP